MNGVSVRRSDVLLVGSGVAGTLVVLRLWPVITGSGWFPAAVTTTTALAAAAVLLNLFGSVRRRQRPVAAPAGFVDPYSPVWEQGLDSSRWLEQAGISTLTDPEIEGFLRAKLSTSLLPMSVEGTWSMPEHLSLLATAFALRCGVGEGRKDGQHVLDDLTRAYAVVDPEGRRRALDEIALTLAQSSTDRIRKALERQRSTNGTVVTFLMGLLTRARKDNGVLASGEFLWLKEVDRGAWFALDNLGRRSFHVEGIAAMEHFLHESRIKSPSRVPMVDRSVAVLAARVREHRLGKPGEHALSGVEG